MRYRQIFTQVSTVEWSIAGAVAFLLLSLLAFILVRYRSSRREAPSRKAHATKIELAYWAFLAVFALGFYIWTIGRNAAERRWEGTPAVTVNVTGFRWCWRFAYAHADVVSTGSCIGAVPRHATHAPAPTLPILELPTGETVRFNITSTDVIHGFWMPAIDFKMYAYPDHVNSFEATFTHPGTSVGRCAVYCGLYHFRMDYLLRVVPPATFRHWLASHHGVTFAGARHAGRSRLVEGAPV